MLGELDHLIVLALMISTSAALIFSPHKILAKSNAAVNGELASAAQGICN